MARPRMIVVAGPPGSGKTRYFPVTAFGVDAFNIDDRCAQICGSSRAIPRDVRRAVAKSRRPSGRRLPSRRRVRRSVGSDDSALRDCPCGDTFALANRPLEHPHERVERLAHWRFEPAQSASLSAWRGSTPRRGARDLQLREEPRIPARMMSSLIRCRRRAESDEASHETTCRTGQYRRGVRRR
jgi:hypothetical protein